MDKYNKTLGNFGELIAEKYLISNKYKIIEKNYRCRFGELDIIALDRDCLAFIEVKTRTSDQYGNPANAINFLKKKHLINSALNYISHKRMGNYYSRFDVIEIYAKNADNNFEVKRINLIKNAFNVN